MTSPLSPLPPIPSHFATVQVYVPQIAFNLITRERAHVAAKRLKHDGRLRWEASTHKMPSYVRAGSVRVTCSVAEASIFLECFRDFADTGAQQDDDLPVAIAAAVTALLDGIEHAIGRK